MRCEMAGLSNVSAVAVLRADDLARARKFYTDVLGFAENTDRSTEGMAFFSAGNGTTFTIYARPGMSAPENTVLAFPASSAEFDSVAAELRAAGVVFEEYDMPEMGLKTVNGVAEFDGAKTAWFKDTEGNILNLVSM
jgi:catechol 2,3-dioxygenase-like lactoylglutathione lyase family enzyme